VPRLDRLGQVVSYLIYKSLRLRGWEDSDEYQKDASGDHPEPGCGDHDHFFESRILRGKHWPIKGGRFEEFEHHWVGLLSWRDQRVVGGGDEAHVGLGQEAEGVWILFFDGFDHVGVGLVSCDIFLFGDQGKIGLVASPFQVGVEWEDGGGGDEDDAAEEKSPAGNFGGGGVELRGGGDGFQLFHVEQSAKWWVWLQWH